MCYGCCLAISRSPPQRGVPGSHGAAVALGLLSPPNLYCMAMGQTGAFVSALLLAALSLTPRQPFAAGLAAAGIVIKPHFGLLMPICFLAARQYRAVLAAAFGLLILCLLPLALVDPQIWTVFLFCYNQRRRPPRHPSLASAVPIRDGQHGVHDAPQPGWRHGGFLWRAGHRHGGGGGGMLAALARHRPG